MATFFVLEKHIPGILSQSGQRNK